MARSPSNQQTAPVDPVSQLHFPPGHFYSPIIDRDDLSARQPQIWPDVPIDPPGIDFNLAEHERILTTIFPKFMPDYRYPEVLEESPELTDFFTRNSQFSWLDARALFVLLREWRPRRVIEVGSGFSTLMMADVNRRFLGGETHITAVEPYPRAFLANGLPGIAEVIVQKVQDVPLSLFDTLGRGDLLFIDSSHVSKTGSDVNRLFLDILPRLASGVRVHVHDVFFPHDYLKDWVLGEGRSWNEQYLLQAFLMFNAQFRVTFGCSYAFARCFESVRAALNHPNGAAYAGGSLYFERV